MVPNLDNNEDNNESNDSKRIDENECERMVDSVLKEHDVDLDDDNSDDKDKNKRHDIEVEDNQTTIDDA